MREWAHSTIRTVAALITALALTILVIRLAHGDPVVALQALWSGAFGSVYAVGNTLNKVTPLLLTGLGVAIAFRAQLWNIGGEGQFLVGTVAASAIGAYGLKNLPAPLLIPLLLVGGAAAGAIWSGMAGWMRVKRGVPEVISTIMLNFVAAELISYLVGNYGPMQEADKSQPASEALSPNATLPIILNGTALHAGFLIALAAVVVVAIFLYATRAGFALRTVGANIDAARVAGIDVERTQIATMLWSGALCGLAGAVELSGLIGTVYQNYDPGYGFTAVAVALLGRLSPYGIVGSAVFFGALAAGSGSMERSAGISSVVVYVVQAVALLVLLAFQWIRWRRRKPSAGAESPIAEKEFAPPSA